MLRDASHLDYVLQNAATRFECSPDDLLWWAFPETWASTSLGFGGFGGQAITTAQTFVVTNHARAALYWGGRFAREIQPRDAQEIAAARRSR